MTPSRINHRGKPHGPGPASALAGSGYTVGKRAQGERPMSNATFYRGNAGKDRSLVGDDFPSPLRERDRGRHAAAGPVRVLSQAGLRVPDRFQPGLRAGQREIPDAAGHGNLRRLAARHAEHGDGAPPEDVRRLRDRGGGTGEDPQESDHVRLHRPAGADRVRGRIPRNIGGAVAVRLRVRGDREEAQIGGASGGPVLPGLDRHLLLPGIPGIRRLADRQDERSMPPTLPRNARSTGIACTNRAPATNTSSST